MFSQQLLIDCRWPASSFFSVRVVSKLFFILSAATRAVPGEAVFYRPISRSPSDRNPGIRKPRCHRNLRFFPVACEKCLSPPFRQRAFSLDINVASVRVSVRASKTLFGRPLLRCRIQSYSTFPHTIILQSKSKPHLCSTASIGPFWHPFSRTPSSTLPSTFQSRFTLIFSLQFLCFLTSYNGTRYIFC